MNEVKAFAVFAAILTSVVIWHQFGHEAKEQMRKDSEEAAKSYQAAPWQTAAPAIPTGVPAWNPQQQRSGPQPVKMSTPGKK
jgi:hypothetical protein